MLSNETVLIISLLLSFTCLVAMFKLLGAEGVTSYIALSTVLANIEVMVLVKAFGMEQTLGNTLFAASFLATDILSEVYGEKEAKKGVLAGVCAVSVFMIFSFTWRLYTPSINDVSYPLLRSLFALAPRVALSSLFGYAVSGILDVKLYHIIMRHTQGEGSKRSKVWLRNNVATLISQLVNIIVFNVLAFAFVYSWHTLISMTLSCYVIYIATSLLDTPFLYLAIKIASPSCGKKTSRH